jgi:signal transduction histidine kinase
MREVCGTGGRIGAAMETQQLNVLYGIAQAISAAEFRARTVLAGVCSTVADAFAFERVAIFRYLEDIDSIVPFVAHGGAAADTEGVRLPAPLRRLALFRQAREAGRAVLSEDVSRDQALTERAVEVFGVQSLVVVPLLSEGRCLGFLVADRGGSSFTLEAQQLDLLSAVGSFVAVVLEKAIAHSELRRVNELKSEFLALASHELRTPAAAVYGLAWPLADRGDSLRADQVVELRSTLLEQANRLRTLVDQLLDLSRLEAHAVRIAPERFAVRERLEELVRLVATLRADEVVVDAPTALTAVADSAAFDRIVSNLIANALRYGATPVRVAATCVENVLRVAVEDRGDGVPAEFVPRLFDRFARGMRSVESPGGAGLGLAIAQSYAHAHGGYIRYEEAVPKGARFELVLPTA